jgi:capsular exopolysaccharide synthesis family protein
MPDGKVQLEKIDTPETLPVELDNLSPRYPTLAGQMSNGSYGYGYGYGEDEKHHLRNLLRVVRRRKWLIALLVLVITTLVTIEMYRTKSIYESSAMIEIGKDSNVSMRQGDLALNEEYDPFYQVNIKTKILFLKSPNLLEQVVLNQKLYDNPQFLKAGGKKSIGEALNSLLQGFGKKAEDARPEVVSPVPTKAIEPDDHEALLPYVNSILASLTIEPVKETRAIRVAYLHNDPKIAQLVTAGITEAFLDSNIERKVGKFKQTAKWLEESANKLKAQAEKAEQDLANYARNHNIYNTEGSNTLATEKLTRLHDQWLKAQQETMVKRSLYEEVKAGRVKDLPEAFADMVYKSAPRLATLQTQLAELEKKRAGLATKYGPDYPDVVENNEQIAATKEQIAENTRLLERQMQADYERALSDEQTIKKQLEVAKVEAVQQNQDGAEYNIKKQEVATNRKLYDDFMGKSNQANLQIQEQQNNLRVIQAAQLPLGPAGPNRFRAILLSLILSLGAGVGLALLLEYLDNTVKTVEDVARYAQLPALGIIPARIGSPSRKRLSKAPANGTGKLQLATPGAVPRNSQLMALDQRSSAAEAYRVLRTSVLLSTAGQPPKLILVTSGQPGEGKTTTAANTAVSLAQLGSSVLIIDCDLRRPAMHKVLGTDNAIGLSTYLSRDIGLDKVIQKLPIDNLYFLPSGSIPPNPAELISSDKMKELLQTLTKTYDHILIDSPPLINVTDPVILSTLVDGVMLVVHGGKSTRDVVRRARQELTGVGAKVFGVVLNNVDLKREGYNDYYYYRYYGNYEQDEAAGD